MAVVVVMVGEDGFSHLQCRSGNLTKHLPSYDFVTTPFIGLTMWKTPPKLSKQSVYTGNNENNSFHVKRVTLCVRDESCSSCCLPNVYKERIIDY